MRNNDGRMDMWPWSSMLVLSLVMTMSFLWYAKRMTESLEIIAESKRQKMLQAESE